MNTSRKRSSNNKVSVFIMAPLRTAGLVLCVWLSCQPGVICAQQIAGQEPETAISSTGPKTPYEEYQSLANQRQQNMQEINRLYATMPIGVVEAQAAQRKKISLLVGRTRELEQEMLQASIRALKSDQPVHPALSRMVMNRIDRHLDGKNGEVPFDPTKALELLQLVAKSDPNHPNLTSYLYYGNLLCNRFDEARKILDKATSEGFTVPASTLPQLKAYEKTWKKELEARSSEMEKDDLPRVLIETDAGNIEIELFENEAPNTVSNFIALVESGFYNGLTFYRVEPTSFCQTGCPNSDGTGDAKYRIVSESRFPKARSHFAGSLSMVLNSDGTHSSQFLITRQPLSQLDGKNTVFGRVIEGMPTVYNLRNVQLDAARSNPLPPSQILKATVLRKRDHPYIPQKIADNDAEPSREPGDNGSR